MADEERKPQTYAEAGVDTDFLNSLKAKGREISRRTQTEYVIERGASFAIDNARVIADFPNSITYEETDGEGIKETLLLQNNHSFNAGWELVAANVNDVVRHGAKPIAMTVDLKLQGVSEAEFSSCMDGVYYALKEADCALIGGETALHNNLTTPGHRSWHLSGTATGVVEIEKEVTGERIQEGDIILGLESSGIHTNGATLALYVLNRYLEKAESSDQTRLTWDTYLEALLVRSKIYVRPILTLLQEGVEVHGLAHITGEGLPRRIPDILPNGLSAIIDRSSWKRPQIFPLIQRLGGIPELEMFDVFNMGIGFVVVVPSNAAQAAKKSLEGTEVVFEIGRVVANSGSRFVLV